MASLVAPVVTLYLFLLALGRVAVDGIEIDLNGRSKTSITG